METKKVHGPPAFTGKPYFCNIVSWHLKSNLLYFCYFIYKDFLHEIFATRSRYSNRAVILQITKIF